MRERFIKYSTMLLVSIALLIVANPVFADFGDTVLKKETKSPDVRVLQEKLSELGYLNIEQLTDYFGNETEKALKHFQKDMGIEDDGIAGKSTIQLLNAKIAQKKMIPDNFTVIKEGDSNDSVKDLQKKLQTLKLYTGPVNGEFDSTTAASVRKFQESANTEATGIVDKDTMLRLNAALAKAGSSKVTANRAALNARVVTKAKKYLGAPYVWGASNGKGFDCSGFVMYVMKDFNLSLAHSASGQFKQGKTVSRDDMQPGDLVFFTTYKKGPSHVGIYIGNNKFIHASSFGRGVRINNLGEAYYKKRFLGAKRYEISQAN